MITRSEFIGLQERIGEIEKKPRRHEARERIVDDHGAASEPVAGIGIADRYDEEADPGRHQNEIQHGILSSISKRIPIYGAAYKRSIGKRRSSYKGDIKTDGACAPLHERRSIAIE
jgi:hypothetical protein